MRKPFLFVVLISLFAVSLHAQRGITGARTFQICEAGKINSCATWTFNGPNGDGRWEDGAVAKLTLTGMGPRSMSVTAVFTAGRVGETETYTGYLSPEGIFQGSVATSKNGARNGSHPWRGQIEPLRSQDMAFLRAQLTPVRVAAAPRAVPPAVATAPAPPRIVTPPPPPDPEFEAQLAKARKRVEVEHALLKPRPPLVVFDKGEDVWSSSWFDPKDPPNPNGWEKLQWGMSKEQVEKAYPQAGIFGADASGPLFGIGQYGVGDLTCTATFEFLAKELDAVIVDCDGLEKNAISQNLQRYFIDRFVRQFGKPDDAGGDPKKKTYTTSWFLPKTIIEVFVGQGDAEYYADFAITFERF